MLSKQGSLNKNDTKSLGNINSCNIFTGLTDAKCRNRKKNIKMVFPKGKKRKT